MAPPGGFDTACIKELRKSRPGQLELRTSDFLTHVFISELQKSRLLLAPPGSSWLSRPGQLELRTGDFRIYLL